MSQRPVSAFRRVVLSGLALPGFATIAFGIAACAKPPGSIAPVSVSSSEYDALSCTQIARALSDNARELDAAEERQRSHVAGDAVGVFLVLIPPSAFTGDASDEVALNKGEDLALRRAFDTRCD